MITIKILPLAAAVISVILPVNQVGVPNMLSLAKEAKASSSPKVIISRIKLIRVQKRLCRFSKSLCHQGRVEYRLFSPYFRKMLLSVVSYESDGFKFKAGLEDKYDIGVGQVNVKEWPLQTLNRFGFNIKSVKELRRNKTNIRVAACILWYNVLTAFRRGYRLNGIYEYSAFYHDPSRFDRTYYGRVKKYLYG